jgi:hypothetical protein
MTDYTKTTNFTAKDALSSGDPEKLILGSDVDTEFDNIATAVATKYDLNDLASQAAAEAGTDNTVLMTPLRTEQWKDNTIATQAAAEAGTNNTELMTPLRTEQWSATWGAENGGAITDIQALADPGGDRYMGWNDTTNAVEFNQVGLGVEIDASTKLLQLASTVAGDGIALSGGVLAVDVSGLPTIEGNALAATDLVYVQDGTAQKAMEVQALGLRSQTAQGTQTLAAADMNSIMEFTATATLTLPLNATTALPIGTPIILNVKHATQVLTVQADTSVTLVSVNHPGGGSNASDTVNAGGTAILYKTAADVWCLSGDISD